MSKKLDEALRAARALVDDKFRAIGVTKHDKTLGRWWGSAATAKLFEHSEGDASIRFECESWIDHNRASGTGAGEEDERNDDEQASQIHSRFG